MRPFPLPQRRLHSDQTAQIQLPFPLEAGALRNGPKTDPKPEPPPAPAIGKIRAPRIPKTPIQSASGRIDRNRKPPAKEVLAPEGTVLEHPQAALVEVQFLRLPQVKAVTGLGKTSIYELIRDKSFPAPVRLGPRAVAWVRSEIRQWALERVHASRSVA